MIDDGFGVFVFVLLAAFIGLLVFAVSEDSKHNETFMKQCMEDHKQYECDALWRAGEDHTTVMPMPVYIGR